MKGDIGDLYWTYVQGKLDYTINPEDDKFDGPDEASLTPQELKDRTVEECD